jgi:hypothetical protein
VGTCRETGVLHASCGKEEGWNMDSTIAVKSSPYFAYTLLNFHGIGRTKKIYCKCGRIIGMDSAQANLKLRLGKELECPFCRNERISKDIDEMNMHFEGLDEDDDSVKL